MLRQPVEPYRSRVGHWLAGGGRPGFSPTVTGTQMMVGILLGGCVVVASAADPSCANGCAVGPVKAVGKDSVNMNGDYTVAGNPQVRTLYKR